MPSQTNVLSGLNPEQIKAVTHKKGPLLIIAGAGTGKTTVITRRIAWLIAEKLAKPGEILALTFTDKAANEMEGRVDLLVPYGYIDISISTFHAFGDRVLRDHALDLGLRPDYRVLSKPEQMIFFREHLFDLPLKHYKSLGDPTKHVAALIDVISRAKDEDVSPEEFLNWAGSGRERQGGAGRSRGEKQRYLEVAKVYKKYQDLKMEKGYVDFGDQVDLALRLFREQRSVLKQFQERYKFILVDEFQDTNYAQFELLKLLAGKNANITVVGDDDQSIYKFRGAAISNILNFQKVYPKSRQVVLNRNYRSTRLILDAARRLIKHNDPERLEVKAGIDKKLVALPGKREKRVEHRHFDRVGSEADWVARTIKEKFEAGQFQLKDFAILVRSNAEAEPFRQSLNILGLPHQFSGGGGLYSLPEVKLVVSFLRVIGDPADSASLYFLALSDIYQLDPLELQKISTFAKRRNYTLHHVFAHLDESGVGSSEFGVLNDIKEESRAVVRKIMDDIQYYLGFAKERTTGEVLYQFLKRSGYLARLNAEQTELNDNRVRNVAAFFDKVREFKEISENDRVSEFVKYMNILKEAGDDPESSQPDTDLDAINVLTVHKAKGLEFGVVFMVSLVAEKFPVRARKQPIELPAGLIKEDIPAGDFHLMEERRLFYVGLTRAKKELYLTSAVDYGGKRERKVSQFVLEALDVLKADVTVTRQPALAQIELFAPVEPAIPQERKRSPDEIISLSPYLIDDYLTCPLKYKYAHISRVPLLPNQQINYGSALHKAVQAFFTAKKDGKNFSLKQLHETFANNWSAEGFISRQHEEQRFAAGRAALKRFYQNDKKRKRVPKYVEEEFSFVDDKVQVKGRWDLVEVGTKGLGTKGLGTGEEKIYIVDFKSTEVKDQKKADARAKDSRQLAIYALAWRKMFDSLPDGLELYFLDTGIIGSIKPAEKDLVSVWQDIKKVADGIRAGNYRATPNYRACDYCPYNEVCPESAV
ncbi:MAG: ATP-dependent DNA helicase [Candidatus Margulisbacteria bacterium]|nr:ATP-dependent DNA helicase [Candidatus Margulisiibacteriota bacterium]